MVLVYMRENGGVMNISRRGFLRALGLGAVAIPATQLLYKDKIEPFFDENVDVTGLIDREKLEEYVYETNPWLRPESSWGVDFLLYGVFLDKIAHLGVDEYSYKAVLTRGLRFDRRMTRLKQVMKHKVVSGAQPVTFRPVSAGALMVNRVEWAGGGFTCDGCFIYIDDLWKTAAGFIGFGYEYKVECGNTMTIA